MKRVLITGATGFIGSVLARRLIKEGHEVHAFIRPGSDTWRLDDVYDKFKAIYTVNLYNKDLVQTFVEHVNPEIIYHFAANRASSDSSSLSGDISTNIIGTWNLLEAAKKINYELFVNAGSSSEYGQKQYSMRETDVLEPNSYHSFAKGSQTLLCQTHASVEDKPIVTLRFFSVYGPYERKSRLIPAVILGALNKEILNLSYQWVSRDFIYIDDVVDVCLKIEQLCYCPGEIINIGTGSQSTIKQVVDIVSSVVGRELECSWESDGRVWDTDNWVADISACRESFSWEPKVSLREGLEKTINWMKKNANHYRS